jgi:hypothetical protein
VKKQLLLKVKLPSCSLSEELWKYSLLLLDFIVQYLS